MGKGSLIGFFQYFLFAMPEVQFCYKYSKSNICV